MNNWKNFCSYILTINRYVLNEKWRAFVNRILKSAKKREITIDTKANLFRARKGCNPGQNGEIYPYQLEDMGPPHPKDSTAGRMNPKGIPYYYLSNDLEISIKEVRPYLKENLSISLCNPVKDLKIVDASKQEEEEN